MADAPKAANFNRASGFFSLGPTYYGDSGGGIFDLDGRLIGIHIVAHTTSDSRRGSS